MTAKSRQPAGAVEHRTAHDPAPRRVVIDEFAPIADASFGRSPQSEALDEQPAPQRGRLQTSPQAGSSDTASPRDVAGRAQEARFGAGRAQRPTDAARADRFADRPGSALSPPALSPHVGVTEEAMVEIVHRGDGAVRRPQKRPPPTGQRPPPKVLRPTSGPLSTFGRLFRGRGAPDDD